MRNLKLLGRQHLRRNLEAQSRGAACPLMVYGALFGCSIYAFLQPEKGFFIP